MDARATVIFQDFAPQHISVLLWATAKLGHNPGPHLLTAAISTATAEMANFNPQNVANSLWAYATLGFYPGHAFMAAAARRQLGDMPVSPGLVLVMYGFSARHDQQSCSAALLVTLVPPLLNLDHRCR